MKSLFSLLTFCFLIVPFPLEGAIKHSSSSIHLDVGADGVRELSVTDSGVGIGSTSPSANLYVAGNILLTGNLHTVNLLVSSASSLSTSSNFDATMVINEGGGEYNLRIESASNTQLFYTDAANDRIGIGTLSPTQKLGVEGNILASGNIDAATITATSNLIVPHGTASAPGIAFKNDTDVGLYFGSTSGNLEFYTSGAKRISLDTHMSFDSVDLNAKDYEDTNQMVGVGAAGNSNYSGGSYNTGYGYQALYNYSTNDYNTAVGYQSLYSLKGGSAEGLTAVGYKALYSNQGTGLRNTAYGYCAGTNITTGDDNSALGYAALAYNSTGSHNTAIGVYALEKTTTGDRNTALGAEAARYNTTGYDNTALGYKALLYNESGYNNTAVGVQALQGNPGSSHHSNTGLGYRSGYNITTGANNTLGGDMSGYNLTTGSYNVAMGSQALYSATTNKGLVAVGAKALYANLAGGEQNTAIGYAAGANITTGDNNTTFGYMALAKNQTGSFNSAMGSYALYNSTGDHNTAIGTRVAYHNTSGNQNTAVGGNALFHNQTGNNNVAYGTEALYGASGSSHSQNTAFGYRAGYAITTGANNVFLGYQAGDTLTSGSHNIIIGDDCDTLNATSSYYLNIGNLIYGHMNTPAIGINVTNPTYTLEVGGNMLITGSLISSVGNVNMEGDMVMNEEGASVDFRVESDTQPYAFFVQGSTNYVGFGTSTPDATLTVMGNTFVSDNIFSGGNILPSANSLYNIGSDSRAFLDVVYQTIELLSDERHKSEIEDLDVGLNEIMKTQPKTYRYRQSNQQAKGFIAQDLAEILPLCVNTPKSPHRSYSIRNDVLIPVVIKAFQDHVHQSDARKEEFISRGKIRVDHLEKGWGELIKE
ncbi:MAG: tail fiber domain-containing protein [Planctomycetes bacterium]|nr:tail fiber domain-containing protein [Planctomycetota bacterium]